MSKLDEKVIGFDATFRLDMALFSPKPIETEEDLLFLKEMVGKMAGEIKEMIYEEVHNHQFDDVSVELMTVDYLTPNDLDVGVEIIEI